MSTRYEERKRDRNLEPQAIPPRVGHDGLVEKWAMGREARPPLCMNQLQRACIGHLGGTRE